MPATLTPEKPSPRISFSKSEWWTPRLAAPLAAAAVVRIGLLAASVWRSGPGVVIGADTVSYLVPGRNLLLHGRFFADGVPDLVRTPGYPLFLALITRAGIPFAVAVNVLLSLLCVL